MSLARCPKCGDVFTKQRFSICPACKAKENEKIDLLKHYIDDHPKATIDDLELVSGLTNEEITQYIRENRLIVESQELKIKCESCGEVIITGRLCRACRDKLAEGFSSSLSRMKDRKKPI